MNPLNTSASKTGNIPADKRQSSYKGSAPTFGGEPQFGTKSVFHQDAEDSRAFASFANSDFQTFGRLAQCGANQSFSDQGHEGNEIGRFENTAENGVNRLIDYQRHRGYEKGQFEMKAKDERQFSTGDLAAKGEINDEELSHGHRKTKTEETETRKSNFEELGLKFENTSLTNTQFNKTHSPQKSPLRPPTLTTGSVSDRHSEGHAFSEDDPKVATGVFSFRKPEIPYANLQGVGEIKTVINQSSHRGYESAHRFGEKPQFGTGSSFQNQQEFQNTEDNQAFAGYGYSGSQTFERLAQCGSIQSFSNQGHRATKGETDDGDWSHRHRKTKTEESETRKSSFEELGYKFENTSLINTPFNSTDSPQKPSLRPSTFTFGSGSDRHSEGHAFSEGDPKVASHGFNIQNSQIPYANRSLATNSRILETVIPLNINETTVKEISNEVQGVGEIQAIGSQSSYRGDGPAPTFGGVPQFRTGSSFQNQSEFHQNAEDSRAFVGYGYIDSQTFGRLAQYGSTQSFSDQGHRAAKGETDDEEWSHGHRKTKTEESETRNSNFEELGFKFKNTSLTNTPFHSTHSPQKSPSPPPTFTTDSGPDRHSEGHAFSEDDPKVATPVFNFRKPEIPNANQPPFPPPTFTTGSGPDRHSEGHAFSEDDPKVATRVFNFRKPEMHNANQVHDAGKNPADGSQPSYRSIASAHSFGGEPQFYTGSLLQKQKQSENHQENCAFARYENSDENSDYQTLGLTQSIFGGLTQSTFGGPTQSYSDQGYRETPKE